MWNIFKGKTCSGLLLIRLIIGIIFIAHGIAKFNMGMDAVSGFFGSVGIPAPMFFAWVVTLLETFGGAALILGVAVELVAALLIIVMIVALSTAKNGVGLVGGYELELALIAALIPSIIHGSGRFSLSRILKKRAQEQKPIATI